MTRWTSALLAALVTTAAAPAQDWAKARLEKSPRHGEWVKIKHDNREVQAFVVYPEVKEKAAEVKEKAAAEMEGSFESPPPKGEDSGKMAAAAAGAECSADAGVPSSTEAVGGAGEGAAK